MCIFQENKLSVWHLEQLNNEESKISGVATLLENEPSLICDVPHTGDVTDLSVSVQMTLLNDTVTWFSLSSAQLTANLDTFFNLL